MSDWLTIKVVLEGSAAGPLPDPPGRVLLVSTDHTLAELAEAIDIAFGRWDLTPIHSFTIDGATYVPGWADEPDAGDADSEDTTVGELRLRPGSRFDYIFDIGEDWRHTCSVASIGEEAEEEIAEDDPPDAPVPVFGWGTIPDQYGRVSEDDGDDTSGDLEDLLDDEEMDDDVAGWDEGQDGSWTVVAEAVADIERPLPEADLAAITLRLRDVEQSDDRDLGLLWAAADLPEDEIPHNDAALWLELAAAVVEPSGEELDDLGAEEEAAWTGLDPADWAGAVIELVRAGVGQSAGPDQLIAMVARCPEVEGDELGPDDAEVIRRGFGVAVRLWQTLGALDDALRLTPLGLWGLPESLRLAWADEV